MAYPLRKSVTSIGRHPRCDVVLPATFDRVSREHAQIRHEGSHFVLYDTSSAGTSVNGRHVRQHPLREGDQILLADQARFSFWRGALHGPETSAPPPAPTRLEPSPVYGPSPAPYYSPVHSDKNRMTAGLLAILVGGIGVHKFYLNRPLEGLLYLLFSWTAIPALLGLIEGITYLSMSEADFAYKYGR